MKKKLQILVDTKSRPKQKQGCHYDVKIVDFLLKIEHRRRREIWSTKKMEKRKQKMQDVLY